jgi:hypothetical protein
MQKSARIFDIYFFYIYFMRYLRKFNESTQSGDKINWHNWNNELKRNCVDFTKEELEFLEKFKKHCEKLNYEVTIGESRIVILPTKYEHTMEPKSEIWKHDGFFVIQTSRMWKRYGNSYEEGSREAYRCDEENIYDVIGKYDLF